MGEPFSHALPQLFFRGSQGFEGQKGALLVEASDLV